VGLESPLLFLTPGWGYVGEDADEVFKRSADSLSRIVERAAERGITGVLEALQPVESHVVNDTTQLRRMVDEVGHPSLKVAVDIPAMAVAGETVADYTRAFGADLVHAHFVDGAPDGHLAWGDGELPMERYLEEFAAGGFTGYLSFELIASRYWLDPKPPVQQSLKRIRAALA
jgi:protein FrlC